ncbi:hypothetical protein ASC72_11330 [Flavobacterium sp. Root420]|nr:hypothetical protein ASC72_11330 [Flavobacterium sp. Root420]
MIIGIFKNKFAGFSKSHDFVSYMYLPFWNSTKKDNPIAKQFLFSENIFLFIIGKVQLFWFDFSENLFFNYKL